jgi:hypothetical protein
MPDQRVEKEQTRLVEHIPTSPTTNRVPILRPSRPFARNFDGKMRDWRTDREPGSQEMCS